MVLWRLTWNHSQYQITWVRYFLLVGWALGILFVLSKFIFYFSISDFKKCSTWHLFQFFNFFSFKMSNLLMSVKLADKRKCADCCGKDIWRLGFEQSQGCSSRGLHMFFLSAYSSFLCLNGDKILFKLFDNHTHYTVFRCAYWTEDEIIQVHHLSLF